MKDETLPKTFRLCFQTPYIARTNMNYSEPDLTADIFGLEVASFNLLRVALLVICYL